MEKKPDSLSGVLNALLWITPIFFLTIVFWDGLQCWFLDDDFAWLSLLGMVHSPSELLSILFQPQAQGTIRPWSERGFFLLFEQLFGLDALPFRIAAFLTMGANLLLTAWIMRRVTGSAWAGFVAAIVWAANASLSTVMTWSSAYNQAMCPFFMLAALALFIRYAETARPLFWWLQLAVFVLGFGALEINVVYPAIAVAWTLFVAPAERRRQLLLSSVPLVVISIAYYALHRALAPLPTTGPYALQFDAGILRTLALYGKWSLQPAEWASFGHSRLLGNIVLWTGILAVAAVLLGDLKHRRFVSLFFAAWYLGTMAPVLPLPNHHTDYYLTIPLCGLGMLAGWGFHQAWVSGRLALRTAALIALAVYLGGMVPLAMAATHWLQQRTVAVRGLVLGIDAAHQAHPNKVLLVDGVTEGLYIDSLGQGALNAIGQPNVYLTPETAASLHNRAGVADPERFLLDPAVAFHALQGGEVVVYSFAGDHLRNITEAYERSAPNRLIDRDQKTSANPDDFGLPERVDAGNPLYSWLLGPSWLPAESGARWMPGQATVRLRRPRAGDQLLLEGTCPGEELKRGPRHVVVNAVKSDGTSFLIGATKISDPESEFRRLLDIPPGLLKEDGLKGMQIEIRVDPVIRKDGVDYGLVFGKIALISKQR